MRGEGEGEGEGEGDLSLAHKKLPSLSGRIMSCRLIHAALCSVSTVVTLPVAGSSRRRASEHWSRLWTWARRGEGSRAGLRMGESTEVGNSA